MYGQGLNSIQNRFTLLIGVLPQTVGHFTDSGLLAIGG